LGLFGFFYIADALFVAPSGLWYSTIIVSVIMVAIGLVLLWKEWGLKSRKKEKSRKRGDRGQVSKGKK